MKKKNSAKPADRTLPKTLVEIQCVASIIESVFYNSSFKFYINLCSISDVMGGIFKRLVWSYQQLLSIIFYAIVLGIDQI